MILKSGGCVGQGRSLTSSSCSSMHDWTSPAAWIAYNVLLKYPIYFEYPVRFSELIGNIREFIIPKKTPKNISGKAPYRFVTKQVREEVAYVGLNRSLASYSLCNTWVGIIRLKDSSRDALKEGNDFGICQVIYSQFGLAIHQNDHQARRRFVEWAQNEIAVVPDFHKRILFSDEAHFWLNGYVNKQNCRLWSEANSQVYVETPLHPEKLTVWCALWAGGILLQKR
ncbi:hypothetical protein TNCV_2742041 [Trichonephila clavipes]|nr:hypothetical protein TNCV_2742041 [Trichonephila clavipes]